MIPVLREGQKRFLEEILRVKVQCFWLEGGVLHVIATRPGVGPDAHTVNIALEVRPDADG
jgi:hypothetical protein